MCSQVDNSVSVEGVLGLAEKDVPSSVFVPIIKGILMKAWEAIKEEG